MMIISIATRVLFGSSYTIKDKFLCPYIYRLQNLSKGIFTENEVAIRSSIDL